jgi:putative ABC transport system permease protein
MRSLAHDTSGRSMRRIVTGLVVLGLGIASLANGLFGSGGGSSRLQSVGLGVFVVFLGVTILGPIIARRLSRVIGFPLPKLRGMPGNLARENAMRNPKRTSSTAAALMIGVGLVGFITIFAASTKASVNKSLDKSFSGDFVIATNTGGFGGLSPQLAAQLKKLPEVDAVSSGRFSQAKTDHGNIDLLAVDQSTWGDIVDLDVTQGKLTDLGTPDTVAVFDEVAATRKLKVGDSMPVTFLETGNQALRVVAIFSNKDLAGNYVTGLPTYDKNIADKFDSLILINKKDSVPSAEARAAIEKATAPYPLAKLKDQTEYKDEVAKQIDGFVNLVYALLALAVIIALFGIANALALSIFERTSELGLLRAVGMTRRQVRTMVRWESVIVALLGTFLGLVIGLFFGWALIQALKDEGIDVLRIPVTQLIVVTFVAAVAGVVAAVFPARRAAKLDVLKAIATT